MKRGELINALEQAQSAMRNVIAVWEKGDLAAAIREMQEVLAEEVDPAIAWWESENE
jgi:hypothetical protein